MRAFGLGTGRRDPRSRPKMIGRIPSRPHGQIGTEMEPDLLSYQDSWRCVMWLLSGIGLYEVLLLIAVIASFCCLGKRGMRWLVVVVPLLTFSVVASPPDPLSMLVTAVPLFLAFAFGSYWGLRWTPLSRPKN